MLPLLYVGALNIRRSSAGLLIARPVPIVVETESKDSGGEVRRSEWA